MEGSFQAQFDRYIEDHIGFRNFFVRLNNQIDFSLFDKANADGVVVGKDKMLYEYDYIRAYTGGDFVGERFIDKKLRRLKFLQRHLKNNFDIDFILMFEPSKARVYPDYIHDRFLEDGFSTTNYDTYKRKAQQLGVRFIDLNQYFLQLKDTIRYPLYPKYGIHWSEHTMTFVADTLTRLIESVRNIELPEYEVSEIRISDSLADSDYDVGKTINLLWQLPHQPMPYPVFSFNDDQQAQKPMVLAVADSYYWNFFNTRIPKHLFANEDFWYFNARVYPDTYFGERWTHELDLRQETEKQDVILLSVTDRFMYKFDWGFVDQVYNLYGPDYSGDFVYSYENSILKDSEWFDRIVENSEKKGVPLSEAIHTEAKYQAWASEPDLFLTWYGMEHFTTLIDKDTVWSKAIREKAASNNVSYGEQLKEDADYIFRTDHPETYKKHMLIKKYQESISKDPAWMEAIAKKAAYFEMPVEEMISVDAEYMADQELSRMSPDEEKIKGYEDAIRNDPEWLEAVRQKAEARGVPLDEMIREDARYMAEQEKKDK